MNDLQVFNNAMFGNVRILMHNNEPWFVAKDVCDCLEIKNTTDAIKRLDEDEQDARRHAELTIVQQAPKVLFADAVATSHTSILIGDLAKLLKQNGVDTGQKRLFEQLRSDGYLIKSGNSKNMPTQRSMEMGLFEVKESTLVNSDGSTRITRTTKVTGKGQVYFVNKYAGRGGIVL